MVAAVIVAAGRSSRMGRPKGLLVHPLTGQTFTAHLASCAREGGAGHVVVVGRSGDGLLREEAERSAARFVENPRADDGQLSSLLAGLDAVDAPGLDAVLMMPVDVPRISPVVVSTLLRAAKSSSASIVRATHGGRHGHPVLFKRAVFEELRAADPSAGARAIVRADARRVLDVEVEEPGVCEDLDTPEDFTRVFGRAL